MGKTLLHHVIFRLISCVLLMTAIAANIFSNYAAKCILVCAAVVCIVWSFVNMIFLFARMKKYNGFWGLGLVLEPCIWEILIIFATQLLK